MRLLHGHAGFTFICVAGSCSPFDNQHKVPCLVFVRLCDTNAESRTDCLPTTPMHVRLCHSVPMIAADCGVNNGMLLVNEFTHNDS